ncbi:MAG: hypothetical protein ACRDF6_12695 [bacterium]
MVTLTLTHEEEPGMRPQEKSVAIFMADDDVNDRLMTREGDPAAAPRWLDIVELPGDPDAG